VQLFFFDTLFFKMGVFLVIFGGGAPQLFAPKNRPISLDMRSFLIARLGNYFYDLETIVAGEDDDLNLMTLPYSVVWLVGTPTMAAMWRHQPWRNKFISPLFLL
jgi:hypothetical protein